MRKGSVNGFLPGLNITLQLNQTIQNNWPKTTSERNELWPTQLEVSWLLVMIHRLLMRILCISPFHLFSGSMRWICGFWIACRILYLPGGGTNGSNIWSPRKERFKLVLNNTFMEKNQYMKCEIHRDPTKGPDRQPSANLSFVSVVCHTSMYVCKYIDIYIHMIDCCLRCLPEWKWRIIIDF